MVGRFVQRAMPDFLGIGAHRSGTTWLWENIRRHPGVWFWRTKELHFFDRRLERRYFPFLSLELEAAIRYSLFFVPGKLAGKIAGEITPAYALLPPQRIALIRTLMPSVKIFFIMRDPVSRAWSHAKKDYSRLTGGALEEASKEDLLAFFQRPQVAQRGDYLSCLRNWTRFFDLNRFFICFTQDIATEPVATLKKMFHFLGLDPNAELDWNAARKPVHVKPGISVPNSVRDYLSEELCRQDEELQALIDRDVPWG